MTEFSDNIENRLLPADLWISVALQPSVGDPEICRWDICDLLPQVLTVFIDLEFFSRVHSDLESTN